MAPKPKATAETSEAAWTQPLSSAEPSAPAADKSRGRTFEAWVQRAVEGSRRMATDKAYRKKIAKRIS